MNERTVLVTGSLGLVGSAAVERFLEQGAKVIGVDNNMRMYFFGEEGSVDKNRVKHERLIQINQDLRECAGRVVEKYTPDLIIHAAAQPSHDYAATDPITDFDVNARVTLLLLEAFRKHCSCESVFIYVSTNKVYGDHPNNIPYMELDTRYMPIAFNKYVQGVNEMMPVDQCTHSLFGVSKLSGDLLTQEYGRYFKRYTGVFRCGCITGAAHSGVPLHGFLSYIARCAKEKKKYMIYGFKGKQVRDIIHAKDLVEAFDAFCRRPSAGAVYNMGGGFYNTISVIEALKEFGVDYEYFDEPRRGDHRWYVTDFKLFRTAYPNWRLMITLNEILDELKQGTHHRIQ